MWQLPPDDVGARLSSVRDSLYRAGVKRQHTARIGFLRHSIAFWSLALAICAYALWPYERSITIEKPEGGVEQTTFSVPRNRIRTE